jgi:hypothetical protein
MKLNHGNKDKTTDDGAGKNPPRGMGRLITFMILAALGAAVFRFATQPKTQPQVVQAQPGSLPEPVRRAAKPAEPPAAAPVEVPVPEIIPAPAPAAPAVVSKPQLLAKADLKPEAPVEAGAPPPPSDEKIVRDPMARKALASVGFDEEAEAYWFAAIQDTSLPKSERQDLIDDLNEQGLPDPKHPTLDDLPLILSRIAILEDMAASVPKDLDWVESYNDLLNLADLATGGGKPVN